MILKTDLFPYQQEAVDKLLPLRIGALYMEMGTGKTRTALEMIKRRQDLGKLDKVLWFCPCSVKANLRDDLDKHADGWKDLIRIEGIESISSSVNLISDLLDWVKKGTVMLIVDESNLVKNGKALRTERIQLLSEFCRYRMILNGTPVTKTYADLFAQWKILDCRVLGYKSFYSFAANHIVWDARVRGRIRNVVNVDYIVEKIAPYSFQVKKDDVLSLPDKYYSTYSYDMTDEQERQYDDVADYMICQLDDQKPSTIYRMFAALQAVISGQNVWFENDHMKTEPMFDDPEDNPRLELLQYVLEKIDGKAIIYCEYLHEIESIKKILGPDCVTFSGEDNATARAKNIEQFKGPIRYLVAMKSCAGYGLNLQFCHNLVYYNNDFNFGTRAQSEDRVHRIGQTDEVNIYDLKANRSLDVRILNCLNRKECMVDDFKEIMQTKNASSMKNWLKGVGDEKRVSG